MNENREFVKAFNADSERLQNPLITLILSLTSFSVRDILFDEAGNPTYAARSVGVSKNELSILEVNPSTLTSGLALVPVGTYTNDERDQAYKTHSEAFNVRVPTDHKPTCEPLLLRNAMEIYQQDTLPAVLTAQAILERTIVEKLQRTRGGSVFAGRAIITELAHRLGTGQDVTDFWLYGSCPTAEGLFEAAVDSGIMKWPTSAVCFGPPLGPSELLEHFLFYCRPPSASLNQACAFAGVMSGRAWVMA